MIHFLNIDEVANFRIRKYSENLSISIFPFRDSTRNENITLLCLLFHKGGYWSRATLKQTIWMESLSLKCGMFMNETWTLAPIITLKVNKNSRDLLSLSKLFNEQKWKEYIHVYVYEYMFNFENWKKKSSPRIPMLCIWTVRGRNMHIFYYNFLNFLWKWRPMKF
jgi:hypothetical protein